MTISVDVAIDYSSTILFLGSGFTRECKNILGEHPPSAPELRDSLADVLEEPAYKEHSLPIVSEAAISLIDLHDFLHQRFTITEVPEEHRWVLKQPWRRIYTVNYDDAAEFILDGRPSFDASETKPTRFPEGSIVHLHGYIRAANSENIGTQLILGERSYAKTYEQLSLWFSEFDRDIRYSTKVIFIGFSMSDLHITNILMKDPDTINKVTFIMHREPDRPTSERLKGYGSIQVASVEQLSSLMRGLPAYTPSIVAPQQIKSLKYIDPFQDKKALSPATTVEIRDLLTRGTPNLRRVVWGFEEEKYTIKRRAIEASNLLERNAKTYILDGDLGNGKTVGILILCIYLSQRGYKCFIFRGSSKPNHDEIYSLQAMGKVAIFFDSYSAALIHIAEFKTLDNAVFGFAIRSSVRAAQEYEIQRTFPSPIHSINLNGLAPTEREGFLGLLGYYGILGKEAGSKIEAAHDFRDVVLATYNNNIIREAIKNTLYPVFQHQDFRQLFFACYIFKEVDFDVDARFIQDIIGFDPFSVFHLAGDAKFEIFTLDGPPRIRSVLFSSYLMDLLFERHELCQLLERLITSAISRKENAISRIERKSFGRLAGALMQFSFLQRILIKTPSNSDLVTRIYQNLLHNAAVDQEPLFWLQYCISQVAIDPELSEMLLETAYTRAKASPGFETYQLDTFSLHFMVTREKDLANTPVTRFDAICRSIPLICNIIKQPSHRYFALNVLKDVPPFVDARISDLTEIQKKRLAYELSHTANILASMSTSYRTETGSDNIRAEILRVRDNLLRTAVVR